MAKQLGRRIPPPKPDWQKKVTVEEEVGPFDITVTPFESGEIFGTDEGAETAQISLNASMDDLGEQEIAFAPDELQPRIAYEVLETEDGWESSLDNRVTRYEIVLAEENTKDIWPFVWYFQLNYTLVIEQDTYPWGFLMTGFGEQRTIDPDALAIFISPPELYATKFEFEIRENATYMGWKKEWPSQASNTLTFNGAGTILYNAIHPQKAVDVPAPEEPGLSGFPEEDEEGVVILGGAPFKDIF